MYCPLCGGKNSDNASVCEFCGGALTLKEDEAPIESVTDTVCDDCSAVKESDAQNSSEPLPYVNSHMLGAILVTVLCCCIPFGVPAIIFASECQRAIRLGDYNSATRLSSRALTFILLGWIFGAVAFALGIAAVMHFAVANGYGYMFVY